MRKLKANEIECRVAQVSAKGCSLLLYKTARVDRAILDEEFGVMNWQNDFKVIDGKMYGGIGVSRSANGNTEWIWKWDCGTESNTEQEKGQASDCFKRAGFKWGIGVELYTAPFIFIQCETVRNSAGKYELVNKYVKYEVQEIGYADNGDIDKLVIIDDKGNNVFTLGYKKSTKKAKSTITNDDAEYYIGLTRITNADEIQAYYEENKAFVNNQTEFHEMAKNRWKALKEV
jgi:hypothetical protein